MTTPDYPTAWTGWRVMLVDPHADARYPLVSPVKRATWLAPAVPQLADCMAHRGHDEPVPAIECRCGFYAVDDAAALAPRSTQVPVLVEGWGGVVRHRTGWRSEWCRIVGIADVAWPLGGEWTPASLAARYVVPVVPWTGVDEPCSPIEALARSFQYVGRALDVVSYHMRGRARDLDPAVARAGPGDHIHVSMSGVVSVDPGRRSVMSWDGSLDGPGSDRLVALPRAPALREALGYAPDGWCTAADCPLPARPEAATCGRHAAAADIDRPQGGDTHGHRQRYGARRGGAATRRSGRRDRGR